jgi:hypothetical protein
LVSETLTTDAEVAEIQNGVLIQRVYSDGATLPNELPVGTAKDGMQLYKSGNNWRLARVADTSPYSSTELQKLTQNGDAHTLERHASDVTDEALIKRSSSGIAPDGSTIGNNTVPISTPPPTFRTPPYSSKFETPAQLKKALANTEPGSAAFNTPRVGNSGSGYQQLSNGDRIVYHDLADGTQYGKGVPRNSSTFQQSTMVRAFYKKVGTGPNDYELLTMFPDF